MLNLRAEFFMLANLLPRPLFALNALLTLLREDTLLAISSFYSRLSDTIYVIGNASKSILFYRAIRVPILRLIRKVRPLSMSLLSEPPLTNEARWLLSACRLFFTVV